MLDTLPTPLSTRPPRLPAKLRRYAQAQGRKPSDALIVLAELISSMGSFTEVAEEIGVSYMTVVNWRRRYDIYSPDRPETAA